MTRVMAWSVLHVLLCLLHLSDDVASFIFQKNLDLKNHVSIKSFDEIETLSEIIVYNHF
jgi:hypothetical protein